MANTNQLRLTALMATTEWARVTSEQQRVFLGRYIAEGITNGVYNPDAAVRFGFPNCKAENVPVLARELLAKPRIQAVLNLHFRRSAIDATLTDVQKLISQVGRILPVLTRLAATLDSSIAKESK